jgi:hypothetical protein
MNPVFTKRLRLSTGARAVPAETGVTEKTPARRM